MATDILYKGDGIYKISVNFPTGKNWTNYTSVIIEAQDKEGTVIQEAGYPASVADTDLYVPSTSEGIAYFYMLSVNRDSFSGVIKWVLKQKESNAKFTDDNYYNPTFELKKTYLSL